MTTNALKAMRGAVWIRLNNLPTAKVNDAIKQDLTDALAWIDAELEKLK